MSEEKSNLSPWIGGILLVLLYLAALSCRGFTSTAEYEFAVNARGIFPTLYGTFIPKLPAAIATLLTGAMLYMAAKKFKLGNPGTAPVLYLCFPPVWFIGTSASSAPVLAFLLSLAAVGLLAARKERKPLYKFAGLISGIAGATGAAFFAQSGFFNWSGVVMAFLPVLFLTWAIRLEKQDDSGSAGSKMNRLAIFIAVVFILLLIFLVIPPVCRFLKIDFPEALTIFPKGTKLYRPALALIAPLLWLFMVRETGKYAGKIAIIGIALGFFMLTMPPSLPWNKLSGVIQEDYLMPFKAELLAGNPVFFADYNTAYPISYCLNRKVNLISRREKGAIHPDFLKQQLTDALKKNDVVVASADGELESFLPDRSKIKYTLKNKCNIFLFTGEKK